MAGFSVHGPFEITLAPSKNEKSRARFINREAVKKLVARSAEFSKIGCYVFVVAYPKGEVPIYVGRSTKGSLNLEPFNYKNIALIDRFINDLKKKYPLRLAVCTWHCWSAKAWAEDVIDDCYRQTPHQRRY